MPRRRASREKLQRRLGEIDVAIARYLAELDRADEVLSKTGVTMGATHFKMKTLKHIRVIDDWS